MALVLNDRVKETTTTTGTGTINLAGAATNFETFVAGIGDGNTVYYAIVHQDQPEFEVGLGTVTDATPDTLSRTTILSSSNSDGLVSFSAGTKDVFCTLPASKTVFEDSSGQVGIGTDSPSSPLEIKSSATNNTGGLRIIQDSGTNLVASLFGGVNSGTRFGRLELSETSGDAINVRISADSGLTSYINAGDFGIGTTSPQAPLHVDSGTTNTVATFTSTDSGAGFNLTDDSGTSTIQTNGANLRVGVDEDAAVSSSAIQFRVDGSTKATINDSGVLDVDGGITVDDITIDGTEFDVSSGNFKFDIEGDIRLDANGGDIIFQDNGTDIAKFSNNSSDLQISVETADKDIKFNGTDGSSGITALLLDMSEAGAATFNDNVTAFSDERLKDNIETLEDSLDKVEQLRGVTYTRDGKENIGVIAQEIEKILPEIVLTADDEMGTKSVDYSRITAVLIEAVKELSERVKELENK